MKKAGLRILISLILIASLNMTVYATPLDDLRKQKEETQKELDKANSAVSSLKNQKEEVEEEISELDAQLIDIIASVSLLEDEIDELNEQIEQTKQEYEEAKAVEEAQYDAMKLRIKFMYEKGELSYVEILTQAKSFSDMVNKTDYVEKLYEYDRKMLLEYQAAKEAVAEVQAKLEAEEEQLEVDLQELQEEQNTLNQLMEEKKAEAADYDNQISKAKQDAAAYKAKLKQQNSEIKKLEAEEAAKKAAQTSKSSSSGSSASAQSTISNSGGSASGKQIANYACQFIGNPYVFGGTSLTNGCDCSGFTYSVYKANGYNIPRVGTAQRTIGTEVSYSDAQPGDIICYPGHVGIYIGGGQIVHASTPSGGIKIGSATYTTILTVRRVVN